MLYLVTGMVSTSEYEVDGEKSKKATRIVEAETEDSAAEKFREHFDSQTVQYCTYYWVQSVEVFPVIT